MGNFLKKYGSAVAWAMFVLCIIMSLFMLVTAGFGYSLIIFIPTLIFVFPPIIKIFLKKTRLKRQVYFVLALLIMIGAIFSSTSLSKAKKEEQLRLAQEKKQKEEEQLAAEQKAREEEAKKKEEELAQENKNNKKYVASTDKGTNNKTSEQQGVNNSAKQSDTNKTTNETSDTTTNNSSNDSSNESNSEKKLVHANKKTKLYYTSEQRYYNKIPEKDLITFQTEQEAKKYGYKKYIA